MTYEGQEIISPSEARRRLLDMGYDPYKKPSGPQVDSVKFLYRIVRSSVPLDFNAMMRGLIIGRNLRHIREGYPGLD